MKRLIVLPLLALTSPVLAEAPREGIYQALAELEKQTLLMGMSISKAEQDYAAASGEEERAAKRKEAWESTVSFMQEAKQMRLMCEETDPDPILVLRVCRVVGQQYEQAARLFVLSQGEVLP